MYFNETLIHLSTKKKNVTGNIYSLQKSLVKKITFLHVDSKTIILKKCIKKYKLFLYSFFKAKILYRKTKTGYTQSIRISITIKRLR